jgi:hypothetical protein
MKTDCIRLLVRGLPGESRPDHRLARRQMTTGKKSNEKAQVAADLATFRRSIAAMPARQLKQLHARLTAQLEKRRAGK